MEENLNKNLESKGYVCACECNFHQIKRLGIKEESIPNLKSERRIGVIKRLVVIDRKTKDKSKEIEKIETETAVFKKYWYESLGHWGEVVVVLEELGKRINNIGEIEDNLDNIVKFVHGKDKQLNEYNKRIISIGIRSLFESGEITYWDKSIYFLYSVSSTGKSAGVPLLIAFYSAYYRVGIPNNFSATGEINTEDGSIKGIGSLKEKFVCTLLSKEIGNLILPQENYEEVLRISDDYFKRFIKNKEVNLYKASHWRGLINLLLQWKN